MESTTDFEKLLFLYKTEGKNMSIESFCVSNGINYRAFDKWYRNTHKNIVPVQIIDGPESNEVEDLEESKEVKEVEHTGHDHHISVSMYLGNGVYVKRKHLSFDELKALVLKLEALC